MSGNPKTRTHNGKTDICFDITYKHEGKKIWEKVGWASEGYTANLASELRANRIRASVMGKSFLKKK